MMPALDNQSALAIRPGDGDEIHRYVAADLESAVRFRSRIYGPESMVSTPEYLEWQFGCGDPADAGRSALWLHTTGGVVDGEVAGLATTLRVDGDELRARWLAEWVVDPERRGSGVGNRLLETVTADAPVTMSIKVSEAAQKILRDTGWSDLGEAPLYVHPLDSVAVAKRRGKGALAVLAWLFGAFLRSIDAAAAWMMRPLDVRLDEIDRFDERADALWASASSRGVVVGRRDAASLNRRYVDTPERGYRCFYLSRRGSAVGYAVLASGEHGGVEAGWLIDFFCAAPFTLPLLFAVNHFFRSDRRQAVYCLSTSHRVRVAFATAGYLRRSSGWRMLVEARRLPPSQQDVLTDQRHWFVTIGDSNLYPPRGADPR